MKMLPLIWIFLFPSFLWNQETDSAAVVREVDSLIQVSRVLTDKRDFEQALTVNAAAEKLTLEKLGRAKASCHHGDRPKICDQPVL